MMWGLLELVRSLNVVLRTRHERDDSGGDEDSCSSLTSK